MLMRGRGHKDQGRIGRTVAAAIEDQKRIVQHLMLRGILSTKWRDAITEHTKERVQCKAGHLVKVIYRFFNTIKKI